MKSNFTSDIAQPLLSANIQLYKVNHFKFKKFLEKYTSKNITDESTLRKNFVNDIYKKNIYIQFKYKLRFLIVRFMYQ